MIIAKKVWHKNCNIMMYHFLNKKRKLMKTTKLQAKDLGTSDKGLKFLLVFTALLLILGVVLS